MAHPKGLLGARVNFNEGERGTSQDFDRIGDVAAVSLWHLFARICEDDVSGDPIQGFHGDDCAVSLAVSPLTLSIAAGFGVLYTSGTALAAFGFGPYQPIAVSEAFQVTLAAHDATNPRIDIVCLAPATDDDTSEVRNVKSPATLATSTQTVEKRTRLHYAYQVVEGTPAATPAVPATPAGYIAIAEVRVPATTGDAVVTDVRPRLQAGRAFLARPAEACQNYIPGTGDELRVRAISGGPMAVSVDAGDAVIRNYKRQYLATDSVTVTANGSGLDRVDLVVADEDGTIKVIAGTPDASPVAPTPTAGQAMLAEIAVANGTAGILGVDITSVRKREPTDTAQLEDEAVTTPKLATALRPIYAALTVGAEGTDAANEIPIDIQITDLEGNAVAREVGLLVQAYTNLPVQPATDAEFRCRVVSGGTAISATGSTLFLRTNASGVARIGVLDVVPAGNVFAWVRVEVAGGDGGGVTAQGYPGVPQFQILDFN